MKREAIRAWELLRLLDRMIEEEDDLPGAQNLGEGGDMVRIMSIHKSKGLEFPWLSWRTHPASLIESDLKSATLTHPRLGFSCVRRDLATLKQFTTVPHEALKLETLRPSFLRRCGCFMWH